MDLKLLSSHFKHSLTHLYDSNEAEAIFLMIAAHHLERNRMDIILHPGYELTDNELNKIEKTLTDIKSGMPVQYAIGETIFYGLKFVVNPSVLIPRPETEELVHWILDTIKHHPQATNKPLQQSILDIGTGSGCIAISLKKHLANRDVYGIDISRESLTVAATNAKLNDVAINWIHDDILSPKLTTDCRYAVIVSNPPYIKQDEKPEMHQNVLDFEPHHALFVSNENPLLFYNAIAEFACHYLEDNGWLFFEINENLAKETIELLLDKSFTNIQLKTDMQGKDRMIRCQKQSNSL